MTTWITILRIMRTLLCYRLCQHRDLGASQGLHWGIHGRRPPPHNMDPLAKGGALGMALCGGPPFAHIAPPKTTAYTPRFRYELCNNIRKCLYPHGWFLDGSLESAILFGQKQLMMMMMKMMIIIID